MQIIRNKLELQNQVLLLKQQNKLIGLVPTMGYLHAGHTSLINLANRNCDIVIVSIFINPLQFSAHEDLDKYPRDIKADIDLCSQNAVDILFIPEVEDMLGKNLTLNTYVNINGLDKYMCGAKRPNHFKGVCTIVCKLFNIISPNYAYFGKKDIQQLRILESMATDLDFKIKIIGGETIRAIDGLALSSRNMYLNIHERKQALIIPQTLELMKKLIKSGITQTDKLIFEAKRFINEAKIPSLKLDYFEIVDNKLLQPVAEINTDIIIAIAIFINKTRLIDNIIIEMDNRTCL